MTTRTGHEGAQMFIGGEVEHSPAFSKKTLFVIGEQPIDKIVALAKENNVQHIFLTANQSYNDSIDYNTVATALLDLVYWVTIDYPLEAHARMLSHLSVGVWQSRLFVPMISCKIAKVATCNNNLTIKIDDNFNGANGGVWCWNQQALLDSNRFTDWKEYADDSVIDNALVDDSEDWENGSLGTDEDYVKVSDSVDIDLLNEVLLNPVISSEPDRTLIPSTLSITPKAIDGMTEDSDYLKNAADVATKVHELHSETISIYNEARDSVTEDENVAKTTSVSVDGADESNEPELVAKKSVKAKK